MLACCHARWRAAGLAGVHAIMQSCNHAGRRSDSIVRLLGGVGAKMQLARLAVQLLVFVLALPFACLAKLLECLQTRRRADDPDD